MKKRVTSIIVCVAMVLSMGTAMASCGEKEPSPSGDTSGGTFTVANKNITVWGAFGEDYYENFKRDYPDYVLDHATASDASLTTLAASISAGTQPDMFYTNNAANAPLGEAVGRDLIVPLDEYFTRDPDYTLKDLPSWYDMFVKYTGADGQEHIYAVYTDVSVACLLWNKQLFSAAGLDPNTPPKTWSEMKTFTQKLTKTDSNGMVTQAGFTDFHWWYQHWRLTYGTPYQDPVTGKPNINTSETVNVLNFLKSFPAIYGGTDKIPENVKWDQGNVAMSIADVGYYQNMRMDFEYGIAPLPSPDDYKGGDQVVAGYAWQWYGIPKGAKNPDGGWLFSRWAVTKGVSGVMEREAKDNPEKFVPVYMAHKESKQDIFDKYLGGVKPYIKQAIEDREKIYDKISIARPVNAPINSKWENILQTVCGDILDDNLTVTDGLAKIQDDGMSIYGDYYKDIGKTAP